MKSYKGTVAESLLPTFENVSREFITETLYKILFSKHIKLMRRNLFDWVSKLI